MCDVQKIFWTVFLEAKINLNEKRIKMESGSWESHCRKKIISSIGLFDINERILNSVIETKRNIIKVAMNSS